MVSNTPPHGAADTALSPSITIDFKVPDAGCSANDELAHTHDECIDPEEQENLVEDDVACILIPLHFCDKFVAGARLGITNRHDIDCTDKPDAEPDEGKDVRNHR